MINYLNDKNAIKLSYDEEVINIFLLKINIKRYMIKGLLFFFTCNKIFKRKLENPK